MFRQHRVDLCEEVAGFLFAWKQLGCLLKSRTRHRPVFLAHGQFALAHLDFVFASRSGLGFSRLLILDGLGHHALGAGVPRDFIQGTLQPIDALRPPLATEFNLRLSHVLLIGFVGDFHLAPTGFGRRECGIDPRLHRCRVVEVPGQLLLAWIEGHLANGLIQQIGIKPIRHFEHAHLHREIERPFPEGFGDARSIEQHLARTQVTK